MLSNSHTQAIPDGVASATETAVEAQLKALVAHATPGCLPANPQADTDSAPRHSLSACAMPSALC